MAAPTLASLPVGDRVFRYAPITDVAGVERLPFSLRILLENLLRQAATEGTDTAAEVSALLERRVGEGVTFFPARVFGQDILGLVMLLDMAAMREAVEQAGGDSSRVSPRVAVDVIIDHSLQVDSWANPQAAEITLRREYERNGERFAFLRWCASSFDGVRVVPPGKGIMHQLHIENIGRVVWTRDDLAYPDSCVGTDSHTPMINGLGVLGWGVGGIEAEAVMVGKPSRSPRSWGWRSAASSRTACCRPTSCCTSPACCARSAWSASSWSSSAPAWSSSRSATAA